MTFARDSRKIYNFPLKNLKKSCQKKNYFGKKKKHAIKSQIIISFKTKKVLDVRMSNESKHDFKLFKETYNSLGISKDIMIIGDSG